MALTSSHFKRRIAGGLPEGEKAKVGTGQQPSSPVRAITVNGTGGRRVSEEGLFVTQTFQSLARAESAEKAEALAGQVDRIVVPVLLSPADDPYPLLLVDDNGEEETRVLMAGHVGGPPQLLSQERNGVTTFACNYWMEAER